MQRLWRHWTEDGYYQWVTNHQKQPSIAVPSSAVQAVFSTAVTTVAKNLVLDLILALQSQPAAHVLLSRKSRSTLLGDLSAYVTLIDSNNFDIKSAIPLVEQVINNAPDLEI
ncbi:hypothetical protein O988_04871 [Pseudogymnoascus sp. VKM F-3808]|nr:hypothetical protein O988_04871 [Pseudogymnoascus sp. VKM F-3808]